MCQLICYPVKKLVVHVVEAYVKSSSIAHTTLLLLSLSVWCCCSSRGKSDSSQGSLLTYRVMYSICCHLWLTLVTLVRSYINGLSHLLLSQLYRRLCLWWNSSSLLLLSMQDVWDLSGVMSVTVLIWVWRWTSEEQWSRSNHSGRGRMWGSCEKNSIY